MIAQLELWNEKDTGRYERKVYVLPKHLDEKVRRTLGIPGPVSVVVSTGLACWCGSCFYLGLLKAEVLVLCPHVGACWLAGRCSWVEM